MARRLSPEVRRAEILQKTREMIATQGPADLSLRAVARYCGITHPAVLHHFDGLQPLLEEVLAARDRDEYEDALRFISEQGSAATILHIGDAMAQNFSRNPTETRNFDALESEAIASADHPAHEYYVRQSGEPHPRTLALAARDYSDPEAVVGMLLVVGDGLRHRWLRSKTVPDYAGDWQRLRRAVELGFEHLRVPRDSAGPAQ